MDTQIQEKQNKVDEIAHEYAKIFFEEKKGRIKTELIILLGIALVYAIAHQIKSIIINKIKKV